MGGLDHHFDESTSLVPATQADILLFLEANAADSGTSRIGRKIMKRMQANEAALRIAETHWFVHKHDGVSKSVWSRKSVGSAANCAACHRQAENGVFDEDTMRVQKS